MRACGRCGHANADHLAYCFGCGRRLEQVQVDDRPRGAGFAPGSHPAPTGAASNGDHPRSAWQLATTVAATPASRAFAPVATPEPVGLLARLVGTLRSVFSGSGRPGGAEDRQRLLDVDRHEARRLLDQALFDLGRTAIDEGVHAPELTALTGALEQARQRHDAVLADEANARASQAAQDLARRREQEAAENEWQACEAGARQLDERLRELEAERQDLDRAAARPGTEGAGGAAVAVREDHTRWEERHRAARERAAALRASTIAARRKLDQVLAAGREAATATAVNLAGYAQDRFNTEKQIRDLTVEIGRIAFDARLSVGSLPIGQERISRLHQSLGDLDSQIAKLPKLQ